MIFIHITVKLCYKCVGKFHFKVLCIYTHVLSILRVYWSLNRAIITEEAEAQLRCYRKYKTMPLDKK